MLVANQRELGASAPGSYLMTYSIIFTGFGVEGLGFKGV